MAAKRLSEYRENRRVARVRASRAAIAPVSPNYSEVSLTSSCISYSLFSVSFLAIFLIKYRIEYILVMPFVVALFTAYFSMSTLPGSSAQKPEKLFRENPAGRDCADARSGVPRDELCQLAAPRGSR